MAQGDRTTYPASCVSIGGAAMLISGESGIGKSELALALIDRGARLISDDHTALRREQGRIIASPAPNIGGLIEVRNLGLLTFPVAGETPVALILRLDPAAPRFIEHADRTEIAGASVPLILIWPDSVNAAIKAELALQHYGLA